MQPGCYGCLLSQRSPFPYPGSKGPPGIRGVMENTISAHIRLRIHQEYYQWSATYVQLLQWLHGKQQQHTKAKRRIQKCIIRK